MLEAQENENTKLAKDYDALHEQFLDIQTQIGELEKMRTDLEKNQELTKSIKQRQHELAELTRKTEHLDHIRAVEYH